MAILAYDGRGLFEIAGSRESVEDGRLLTSMGMVECDDDLGVRFTSVEGSPSRGWIWESSS